MKSLYNALKEKGINFTHNPPKGASYIMTDGLFVDLDNSESFKLNKKNRSYTHPAFDDWLRSNDLIDRWIEKALMLTDNAIAINDGKKYKFDNVYLNLPDERPTKEQFDALLKWLDYVMTFSGSVQLENCKRQILQIYTFATPNNNGILPEEIIKDIIKIYNKN